MQTKIKYVILAIFSFIVTTFFVSLNKENSYDTSSVIGKKIDEIELTSLNGDSFLNTKDLTKNNFTLINFWASWCAPCRAEHQILMDISKKNKIRIIGINFKDKNSNAKVFLKELGNPFSFVAKDELGKKSIIFGIYGIPESILINKELIILHKFIGPLNIEDYNKILDIINKV